MAFKQILMTGANGMLGAELAPYLSVKGYEVTATDSRTLNLLGPEHEILSVVKTVQPQLIINAAAYTNVDQSELNPELAMAINKDGVRKLAEAARAVGAILIHISTDFVFDGSLGRAYTVQDKPNPVNHYGLSKYYGEMVLSELMDEYYIIRTSWLYGINRNNFVQFVLESARQGREIKIANDLYGTPTWIGSLCGAIESIMTSGAFGLHHASDAGIVSRYEQAVAVCKGAGLSDACIQPVSFSELPMPACRPKYTPLDCGTLVIPNWQTTFQAYLSQYCQVNGLVPVSSHA